MGGGEVIKFIFSKWGAITIIISLCTLLGNLIPKEYSTSSLATTPRAGGGSGQTPPPSAIIRPTDTLLPSPTPDPKRDLTFEWNDKKLQIDNCVDIAPPKRLAYSAALAALAGRDANALWLVLAKRINPTTIEVPDNPDHVWKGVANGPTIVQSDQAVCSASEMP